MKRFSVSPAIAAFLLGLGVLALGPTVTGSTDRREARPASGPAQAASAASGALRIVVLAGQDGVNILRPPRTATPVVEVRDQEGRPAPAVPILFMVRTGAGSASGPQVLQAVTDAAGRAAAAAFAPIAIGPVHIEAVASLLGETARATITQTTYATPTDASDSGNTIDIGRSGNSGAKRWLLLGAAGAAAGLGTYFTSTRNQTPTPGTIVVSPTGNGMVGHTDFTFSVDGASDADGDRLAYFWDFGDGQKATGLNQTHSFSNAGVYRVTLRVGDSKQETFAPDVVVTVLPNLSGAWTVAAIPIFECGLRLNAQQNGTSLKSSTITLFDGCSNSFVSFGIARTNPLTYPTAIELQTGTFLVTSANQVFPGVTIDFDGMTDAAGTTMTGTITTTSGGASVSRPAELRR